MKTAFKLIATGVIGCFLFNTAQAAPKTAKPEKRTLVLESVVVTPGDASYTVVVTSDCDSQNANVEFKVPVTVTYTTGGELPDTLTVTDVAELEVTIPLEPVTEVIDIDGVQTDVCLNTTGSVTFAQLDIDAAVAALVATLVPEGVTPDVVTGCASVAAKAWTESNSVQDSKPWEVPAGICEE